MSVQPSLQAQLAALQAIANHLDQGGPNATLVIYKGTKPASVATAANPSDILVTLNLPQPCLKQVHADHIELYETDTGTVLRDGTASWARLINAAGNAVMDFTAGIAADAADITLNNKDWVAGGTQKIHSIILRPNI